MGNTTKKSNSQQLTIHHYGNPQTQAMVANTANVTHNTSTALSNTGTMGIHQADDLLDDIDSVSDAEIEPIISTSPKNLQVNQKNLGNYRTDLINSLAMFHQKKTFYGEVVITFKEEKKRFLRSNIVVYKIESEFGVVNRQIEEFELLQKKLREKFGGLFVPPIMKRGIGERLQTNDFDTNLSNIENKDMPGEKNVAKEVEADKKVKRAKKTVFALEMFMRELMRNPYLRYERMVADFMKSKEAFSQQRVTYLNTEESEGLTAWNSVLYLCSTPRKPGQLLRLIAQEIDVLVTFYLTLRKELNEYISQLEKERLNVNNLATLFQNWVKIEGGSVPTLNATASVEKGLVKNEEQQQPPEKNAEALKDLREENQTSIDEDFLECSKFEHISLSSLAKSVEKTYTRNSDQMGVQLSGFSTVVKGQITFEICVLKSFKAQLRIAKTAIINYRKANKAYKDAKKQYLGKVDKVQKLLHRQKFDANMKQNNTTQVTTSISTAIISGESKPETSYSSEQNVTVSEINEDKSVKKLAHALEVAKCARLEAVKKYNEILRAILVVELQRFKYERAARAARILRNLTQINFTFSKAVDENWSSASTSMPNNIEARSDINLLQKLKDHYDNLVVPDIDTSKVDAMSNDIPTEERKSASSIVSEYEADYLEPQDSIILPSITQVQKQGSFRAIFDFKREQENERDLKKGEIVVGEFSDENPEWFWVYDQGYVPASHLEACKINEAKTPNQLENQSSEGASKTTAPNSKPLPSPPSGLLASIKTFNKDELKAR